MSLTVGKLKELLATYPDDMVVVTHEAQDIVHLASQGDNLLVISPFKPMGYCKRSGEYAYPTYVEDYFAVCPATNENLYRFEVETREEVSSY
jgi:hypothetical protein